MAEGRGDGVCEGRKTSSGAFPINEDAQEPRVQSCSRTYFTAQWKDTINLQNLIPASSTRVFYLGDLDFVFAEQKGDLGLEFPRHIPLVVTPNIDLI